MNRNVVVSADWLADHLEEVRVVDVRDEWEFEGIGHVPGAVNVPFDSFRSAEGGEGMLPGADVWRELLEEAGLDEDDTVVAYDDEHGVFAARFLVTAELYGHRDLHLLDGDYSAWSRERETTREAPDVERSTYEVRPPETSPLVDYEAVLAATEADGIQSGEVVLLDTRDEEEYEAGHVPGAVHLDWRELVDERTRGLRPREELEAVLEGRGVTPGTRVILYCNTARRISHTYVVLRHLGYEDVGFYEGSLTEWEAKGGPIETGSAESADPS
ncbi:MAG: sulfurtransferase [Salinigranum sp.]